MLQEVLDKLNGHETAAVLKVLDAVAPHGQWTDMSIESLEELQIALSKERLKRCISELMTKLQLRHTSLTQDEVTYLCLRHSYNFGTDLSSDNLPL